MESDAEICNIVDLDDGLRVKTPQPSAAQQHIKTNHPVLTDLRGVSIAPSMVQAYVKGYNVLLTAILTLNLSSAAVLNGQLIYYVQSSYREIEIPAALNKVRNGI